LTPNATEIGFTGIGNGILLVTAFITADFSEGSTGSAIRRKSDNSNRN
jgi:hypothetical protein